MKMPFLNKRRPTTPVAQRRAKILLVVAVAWKLPSIAILALGLAFPLPAEKLRRDNSVVVLAADGSLLTAFLSDDDKWRLETKLDDVPKFVRRSVIAYEDKWFYFHPGVNPASMVRALATNLRHKRVVVGGSTLTMQVARMMEPRPRTMKSKAIEIFRAFQLEVRYSKKEILQFYFNLAPYGGNIEGFAAASYLYFGKAPSMLSHSECVSLIGLPNSPTRLRPDVNFKESEKHRRALAKILLDRRALSASEYESIMSGEMPRARIAVPRRAPHFSQLVAEKHPGMKTIVSTLEPRLQSLAEKALRSHLSPLAGQGIENGAIVIIDNRTREVRAMVGSDDFYNFEESGQVNGAASPRSPGSALKPFAYAMALDSGMISPRFMLEDVPVNYNGYKPVNFDETYRGGIPAEEALKLSLNVPAVNLYAKLGGDFLAFLRRGGVTTLKKPGEYYGLPLILGAGEVNLLELTNLYAMFANEGVYQPYAVAMNDRRKGSTRMLSEGSAYIISQILSDARRPDLPNCWEFSVNLPKVAWKTGTSYGHRDAWSIGYNPDYTVGVWVGNFSGRESDRLIGSEVAAPLLFDIFNSISDASSWFTKPVSVGTRKVCPVSGRPATDNCPGAVNEDYIYGVSPASPCEMHRKYALDSATGLRLSPECSGDRPHTERIYEMWPPRIATWRRREGFPQDEVPQYLDSCERLAEGEAPVIVSPMSNAKFYLDKNAPIERQLIMLDASVPNTIDRVYWFVDGELFASGSPDKETFYKPVPGRHVISCVDEAGRSSETTIYID